MKIPTMKPTGDLPPMILFEDCKKGETSAKTGCTPASGGGGKQEGVGGKAKLEITEPDPRGVEGKSIQDYEVDSGGNLVVGEIAGIPVARTEAGLTDKITKKTRSELETIFSDPEIMELMKAGGMKSVTFTPKNRPNAPKNWSGGFLGDTLLLHPRSMETILGSKSKERKEGGMKSVIAHESAHGVFDNSSKDLRDRFSQEVGKHPEIEEKIGKFLNLGGSIETIMGKTKEERKNGELHAEIQASKHYDPEYFDSLPTGVKEVVNEIMDKATPKKELPPHLKDLLKPKWKR